MKKRAFTLIEIMVSIAIVSILVLLVSSMFSLNFSVSERLYEGEEVFREANKTMAYIENNIREANYIAKDHDEYSENCNFYLILRNNDGTRSKRKFTCDGTKAYLKADNLDNNSDDRSGTVPISSCEDMKLYYDEEAQTIEINLDFKGGEHYQTLIEVGVRKNEEKN